MEITKVVTPVESGTWKLVEIKKIHVETRARRDLGDIQELAEGIRTCGLMNPVVLSVRRGPDDKALDEYDLVAGERRLRAVILLGSSVIPATLWDDLPKVVQKEMELEENIRRKDLDWTEEVENIRQLDELKRQIHGSGIQGKATEGWNLEDTARLVGRSEAGVSQRISIAETLRDRPDIKEKVKGLPMATAIREAARILEAEQNKSTVENAGIELQTSLHLGSCVTLLKTLGNESVDLVLTDPPFGIGSLREESETSRENVTYTAILKETDDLDEEAVLVLMREVIPELARVLKPSRHFYMFCKTGLVHKLRELFTVSGLVTDPVPLIWDKCRATAAFNGLKYSPCYESVIFGWKLPRLRRLAAPAKSILQFPIVSTKDKVHPFEKPQSLLEFFISQSSNLGELVIDPFAGSGSTLAAAKAQGRQGWGSEIDPERYSAGTMRLLRDGMKGRMKT
jgi:site-specific DNA-methyltransferase (adenine-specific)